MNFENFLINAEPDFKNRLLNDIWNFSDEDIEHTHDFIQLLFPLNEKSNSVFHGYYLNTNIAVTSIQSNDLAKSNIVKSSKWFLGFLERNAHWRRAHRFGVSVLMFFPKPGVPSLSEIRFRVGST